MRMIKFRSKEKVLGELRVIYGIGFISTTCVYDLLVKEGLKAVTVGKDIVKQFVGWDADSNEVYEDDVLVDDEGNEYVASLDANLYSTKDATMRIWQPEACDVCVTKLKLKGMSDNGKN